MTADLRPRLRAGYSPSAAAEPRRARATFAGSGARPREADAGDRRACARRSREERLGLVERQAVRLGHERRRASSGSSDVAVERDVDARPTPSSAALDAVARRVASPLSAMNVLLRRVEVAGADERHVLGCRPRRSRSASAAASPTGCRTATSPACSGRRARRARRRASRPCRAASAFDRADVRAAAAAEDERPLGQVGRERERLLGRACPRRRPPPRDTAAARYAASAIASPPSPQARGTRTSPAPNVAAAGVALVLGPPSRPRCSVAAVGAAWRGGGSRSSSFS